MCFSNRCFSEGGCNHENTVGNNMQPHIVRVVLSVLWGGTCFLGHLGHHFFHASRGMQESTVHPHVRSPDDSILCVIALLDQGAPAQPLLAFGVGCHASKVTTRCRHVP